MSKAIHNGMDTIDSRDIIERVDELENMVEFDRLDEEDAEELAKLKEFAAEVEDYCSDWVYGEILVRDSYFEEYARDLAEGLGTIPKGLGWPACHIDWEAAAHASH